MTRLLGTLDPAQRAAICLFLDEGLSWDEVAARLGLPSAGAARMRYVRAVALLRERWTRGWRRRSRRSSNGSTTAARPTTPGSAPRTESPASSTHSARYTVPAPPRLVHDLVPHRHDEPRVERGLAAVLEPRQVAEQVPEYRLRDVGRVVPALEARAEGAPGDPLDAVPVGLVERRDGCGVAGPGASEHLGER